MTLALLVYSIAQRRLRSAMAKNQETIPNQINQPIGSPTLRWVFQLLEGINKVTSANNDGNYEIQYVGISDLKRRLLIFFGEGVCNKYKIVA